MKRSLRWVLLGMVSLLVVCSLIMYGCLETDEDGDSSDGDDSDGDDPDGDDPDGDDLGDCPLLDADQSCMADIAQPNCSATPEMACVVVIDEQADDVIVKWENGFYIVLSITDDDWAVGEYYSSDGTLCNTERVHQTDDASTADVEVDNASGHFEYTVTVNTSAEMTALNVTCPDGSTEQYTEADLAACGTIFNTSGDTEACAVAPDQSATCSSDADCSGGTICVLGYCAMEADSTGGTCTVDADCEGDFVCRDGYCQPDVSMCESDADCESNESCVYGICMEGDIPMPDTCASDSDCAVGEVCLSGLCIDESMAPCDSDADCDAGEICYETYCVDEDFIPDTCSSDADCGAGEVCSEGFCFDESDIPDTCQSDADCGVGEICNSGYCVEDSGMDTCESDDDCDANYICVVNYCIEDDGSITTCDSDDDCDGTAQCIEGICVDMG